VCSKTTLYLDVVDFKVYHHKDETMLKGGVTYVVELNITFNDLLTLGNTYTTLTDTLNQRIPQYCQDYNGIY
jgi:hypothetical protein